MAYLEHFVAEEIRECLLFLGENPDDYKLDLRENYMGVCGEVVVNNKIFYLPRVHVGESLRLLLMPNVCNWVTLKNIPKRYL